MNRAVQAVRGFRLGYTRAASHPFCDIRLLHSGFNLAARCCEARIAKNAESSYSTENKAVDLD
jgi:hypothetical protein